MTRRVGILSTALLALTACQEVSTDPMGPDPITTAAPPAHVHPAGPPDAEIGTTAGWFRGRTVTFLYNKLFDCTTPPPSGAESGCVLGAEPGERRRGGNDPVLYVLSPLGFEVEGLHCPVAGDCINHPSDIDVGPVQAVLESVLGVPLGNGVIPLPAHSHVVDTMRGGWWSIEVVGVLDREAWDAIAEARSLDEVRRQQAAGTATGDIPTNSFLFFNVQP